MSAAQELIKAHAGWGPDLNTAGATLTLKEVSRKDGNVSYRLYAEGLPREKTYTLFQWPVTLQKPVAALQGMTFDEAGVAICAGKPGTCGSPEMPNDPIDFTFHPVDGEPIRIAVAASDDQKLRAYLRIVPSPIAADDQGCHLEGVLLSPHGEIVFVEARSFPADTELAIRSDSEGEVREGHAKSNGRGQYVSAVLPAKVGLKSGKVRIRVSAQSCSPEISVPWALQSK